MHPLVCSPSAHAREHGCMHSRMYVLTDRRTHITSTHITSTGTHAWVYPPLEKYHQNILDILKYILITILYPKKGCAHTHARLSSSVVVCVRAYKLSTCACMVSSKVAAECTHAHARARTHTDRQTDRHTHTHTHTHTHRGDGEGKIWCLLKRLLSATCSRTTLKR